jgi:Domain of unknown function (DUF4082)
MKLLNVVDVVAPGVLAVKKLPVTASTVALGIALLSSAAANAAAINPQLFYSQNMGESLGNPPFTLGWDFTANKSLSVNALGFFDDSQDGLAESHDIGLWDSSGSLLASTTVTTTDQLTNQWRYSAVSTVTLTAGNTYYVGALYLDGNDPNVFAGDSGVVTTTANITYLESTYEAGNTLSFSTSSVSGGPGYFGPNFSASAVPEPPIWAMMLLGFASLGFAGYRKATTAVSIFD